MWKATKDNNSDNVDYSSVKMLNNFHIGRPTRQLLYTEDPSLACKEMMRSVQIAMQVVLVLNGASTAVLLATHPPALHEPITDKLPLTVDITSIFVTSRSTSTEAFSTNISD